MRMSKDTLALEKALKELRKNLEKTLIMQMGRNCAETSNTKKTMVKTLGETKIQALKSGSSSYLSSFKGSAKGQWVNQAAVTFQNTSNKIGKIV